jgi:hypothetical protein
MTSRDDQDEQELDDRELQVLLALYSSERQDNTAISAIVLALVGIIFTYVVAVVAVLSSESISNQLGDWVILAIPSLPLLLYTWIALFTVDNYVRRIYLLRLEDEIQRYTKLKRKVPYWVHTIKDVWEPGSEPPARRWTSVAVILLTAGSGVLLLLFLLYVVIQLSLGFKILLVAIYVPLAIVPIYLLLRHTKWGKVFLGDWNQEPTTCNRSPESHLKTPSDSPGLSAP